MLQSFHNEYWVNPELPTVGEAVRDDAAPARDRAGGDLRRISHTRCRPTRSGTCAWDGSFTTRHDDPSTGRLTTVRPAGSSDRRVQRRAAVVRRTHAHPDDEQGDPESLPARALLGADHQWRVGGQLEKGEHHLSTIIPTGTRFVDVNGQPFQSISSDPSIAGGVFVTAAGFVSDAITVGNRADDQRRPAVRSQPCDQPGPAGPRRAGTAQPMTACRACGTLYTWNVWSPRLGVTMKLTGDGRTMLRASYGRFTQGVLTGELAPFHPAAATTTTTAFDAATGDYTTLGHHRRSQNETCSSTPRCAHRERMSTRLASIGSSDGRSRFAACLRRERMAATSSAGPTSAAAIARRRAYCRMAAACPCTCS